MPLNGEDGSSTTKKLTNVNLSGSPSKNNSFAMDDFDASNPNRSKIQDRSAVTNYIESEQSQGNYNLNKINLPDFDHKVSPNNAKRTTVARGSSPHFSYRNKRDSQSPHK